MVAHTYMYIHIVVIQTSYVDWCLTFEHTYVCRKQSIAWLFTLSLQHWFLGQWNEWGSEAYMCHFMYMRIYVCRRAIVRLHNLHTMTAQRSLWGLVMAIWLYFIPIWCYKLVLYVNVGRHIIFADVFSYHHSLLLFSSTSSYWLLWWFSWENGGKCCYHGASG